MSHIQIKQGRLATPYKGVGDAFAHTYREEGVLSLWRGNTANVIRHFQLVYFIMFSCYVIITLSIEDYFKSLFGFKKKYGYRKWFTGNVASGGAAGASSLLFVYSLDYARTRLANNAKSSKGGGTRQFNGLVDVYKKTVALFHPLLASLSTMGSREQVLKMCCDASRASGMFFSLKILFFYY